MADRLTLQACAAGSNVLLAVCRDFAENRLAHGLLFTGAPGIGKKTFARLLAQALLCTGEGEKPCGQCRDCRRFLDGAHPDALIPTPAPREKTIKIEALRDTINALSHHSMGGGRRVVLIENAERMTPQAQNCLLKTLEEAEDQTYFLLTTDLEAQMLPTIRSRCRIVRMQPWAETRVREELLRRGVPPQRAPTLASFCEGSLGRALQMQEDESYWLARELVKASFLSLRREADQATAAALLKDQKEQGDRLLNILEQELRALLQARAAGRDGAGELPEQWRQASPQGLCAILNGIMEARRQRFANVSWPAVAAGLMQIIAEEIKKWQA